MQSTNRPELPADRGFTLQANGLTVVSVGGPAGTELTLIGELDHASCPTFERALNQALRFGPPDLLLELSGLEFLAVAGARAIEHAHQRCRLREGQLRLANPRRAIRRLLALFGLDDLVIPN